MKVVDCEHNVFEERRAVGLLGCEKENAPQILLPLASASFDSDLTKPVEGLEFKSRVLMFVGLGIREAVFGFVLPTCQIDPEPLPLAMPPEVIRGVTGDQEPGVRHGLKHWEANLADPACAFVSYGLSRSTTGTARRHTHRIFGARRFEDYFYLAAYGPANGRPSPSST
jgi:hypothetical protein